MSDKTLEELGAIVHRTKCDCGGYSKDHDVEFHYWPDKETGDTLAIATGLHHFNSFWKRLRNAFKYVFGLDNTYVFYTETCLNKQEVLALKAYIDKVAADFYELEPKESKQSDSQDLYTDLTRVEG